jgi:hypothetical protein
MAWRVKRSVPRTSVCYMTPNRAVESCSEGDTSIAEALLTTMSIPPKCSAVLLTAPRDGLLVADITDDREGASALRLDGCRGRVDRPWTRG